VKLNKNLKRPRFARQRRQRRQRKKRRRKPTILLLAGNVVVKVIVGFDADIVLLMKELELQEKKMAKPKSGVRNVRVGEKCGSIIEIGLNN